MQRLKPIVDFLDNYWMYVTIGVCLFFLGVVRIVVRYRGEPVVEMRDITMTIEGRRMYVHRVITERICDAILDAVINDSITADEANREMGKLAKVYDPKISEEIIRQRKPAIVKAQLRNNERRRKLNGKDTPVPIPQPKIEKPVDDDSIAAILNRA
jgi:hypothetical protein